MTLRQRLVWALLYNTVNAVASMIPHQPEAPAKVRKPRVTKNAASTSEQP